MNESIYLNGAEEVGRASTRMASAATAIQAASDNLESALRNHQQFLAEWLTRFEQILDHTNEGKADAVLPIKETALSTTACPKCQ